MAKKTAERGALSRAIRKYLAEHPEASPPVIIAALKKQGIKASESLAATIKYRKPKTAAQRAAERAAKAKLAVKAPPPDIRGPRSREIRNYLRKKPNADAKQIIAALKEKGIKVSPALVAAVKQNEKDARDAVERAKKSAQEHVWRGRRFSAAAIVEAKRLVKELGGITNAKHALKVLEELS